MSAVSNRGRIRKSKFQVSDSELAIILAKKSKCPGGSFHCRIDRGGWMIVQKGVEEGVTEWIYEQKLEWGSWVINQVQSDSRVFRICMPYNVITANAMQSRS